MEKKMKNNQKLLALILGIFPLTVSALHYEVTPLVSDLSNVASHTDPNLINSWGLFFVPNGNFWVADNGSNLSTLYQPDGSIVNFVINVASATTGAKLNTSTFNFFIMKGANQAPAQFLFDTEEGKILGFNKSLDPTNAIVAVDNSSTGAVYKGLEITSNCCQNAFLFATDFHNAKIDVFNSAFNLAGIIKDFTIPSGYAPFNVRNLNGLLYVTYAKQKGPDNHDDDPGIGHGFVDVFTISGALKQRLISQGNLNSPWGLAIAPSNFGEFSGALLVGNFGDGKINCYDPSSGQFLGQLADLTGSPIVIDGLWALEFSFNGTLYFSSGPNGENDGLVGTITPFP